MRIKRGSVLLNSLLGTCAKRWKDANRPISAKMGLLRGVLEGYQLNLTPLQFLYSIAMCGLWHPASVMAFSQHWNEQGLNRLRSAVDAASKSILQLLHFDVTNAATSLLLQCVELLKVLRMWVTREGEKEEREREIQSGDKQSRSHNSQEGKRRIDAYKVLIEEVEALLAAGEAVLLKTDDACQEARRARDGVVLLIKFIKESHHEALAVSESSKQKEEEEDTHYG